MQIFFSKFFCYFFMLHIELFEPICPKFQTVFWYGISNSGCHSSSVYALSQFLPTERK